MKNFMITATLASVMLGGTIALAEDAPPPPHPGEGGHPRMERMLEKIDTNKDGVITQAEHDAFTAARFKEMDANGDGKVTGDEMQAHHEKMKEKWGKKGGHHHCDDKGHDAPPPPKE